MELMDAIRHRCAVRDYTLKDVPRATLVELLRTAVHVPSTAERQPWIFCIFQGRNRLKGYSDRIKSYLLATRAASFELRGPDELLADPSYNVFYNAGTLVVICAKSTAFDPAEDCCLAAENLMLAAHGLGLATCPIAFARAWLTLPEVKEELGIPVDLTPVFSVVIGYAAAAPTEPPELEPEIAVWRSGT